MLPLPPMRVTAISDLHGAVEHLDAVGRECDALLVLGDLINVLDYRTWDGILVEVFGRESVMEAAEHRARGRFDEARREYERVFETMPDHAYVTFGNVDLPELLRAAMPQGVRFVDAEAVRLGSM